MMSAGVSKDYYFIIVGYQDNPIFEAEYSSQTKKKDVSEQRHLNQFIAHAALDPVDHLTTQQPNMYLKVVDKFNEWYVSAFVTASRIRFLMLHTQKNEDGIRNFFQEMYENYIKLSMNPFYVLNGPIRSPAFEKKSAFNAKKFLTG